MNSIFSYLDELFPEPKCELDFNNDFEFLIAVVLSAQTTDKKVNKVTSILFSRYDINGLIEAKNSDLEDILKPLGMAKKKTIFIKNIARDIKLKYNGKVPNDINELTLLDGVGRKTANVVLSTLYGKPYFAVDTHVSRVTKRLGLVPNNYNPVQIEKVMYKIVPEERITKTHHQLVLFGRYYCKSKKPMCDTCKIRNICKYNEKIYLDFK